MVKEAVIQKVVRLIYATYKGRCVTLGQAAEFVKRREKGVSYSLVKLALDVLVKDRRAAKAKLHKSYALYCIGRRPKLGEAADHRKIEECVSKYMPSFMLMQVAECVLGRRPAGSHAMTYAAILYVLAKMVKKGTIHSFTVLGDARDRLKVIIQK